MNLITSVITLIIIVGLANLSASQASTNLDIYVDNQASSLISDGSQAHPFHKIDDALQTMSSANGKQANLYIAASPEIYSLDDSEYTFNTKDITVLTISSWINKNSNGDDLQPSRTSILSFSSSSLMFNDLDLLSLSDLNINVQQGSLTLSRCNLQLNSTTLNLNQERSRSFITTSGSANIILNDIRITIKDDSDTLLTSSNYPLFSIFNDTSDYNGELTITGLTIEVSDTDSETYLSPILSVNGYKKVSITDMTINNQVFTTSSTAPLIALTYIDLIQVEGISLKENRIEGTSSNPFFFIMDAQDVIIESLDFSSNSLAIAEEASFSFVNITYTARVTLLNHSLQDNIIMGDAVLFKFGSTRAYHPLVIGVTLNVSNITIQGNDNIDSNNQFTYVDLYWMMLEGLDISDIMFRDNQLSGKVFSFESPFPVEDLVTTENLEPTQFSLKGVIIQDNQRTYDTNFLYFSPLDSIVDQYDCIQPVEPYVITMENLTIVNNAFLSGQRVYGTSLFRLKQTRVYLHTVRVVNNSFESYDFLSLEQKPSTVIVTSSQFINNSLSSSQLINTDYLTLGYTCNRNNVDLTTRPTVLYRYSFIINSTFENITLSYSSALFTLNNGFLIISNNTFSKVHIMDSILISATFSALRLISSATIYIRDYSIEKMTLSATPSVWKIFNNSISEAYFYGPDNFYFSKISNNNFLDINSDSPNFISLLEYGYNQNYISIQGNQFISLSFKNYTGISMILCNSLNTMKILNNTFQDIQGKATIFSLNQDQESNLMIVASNNVSNVSFTTFLSCSISSLDLFQLNNNTFQDISFYTNWISIKIKTTSDSWTLDNNTVINSQILRAETSREADSLDFLFLSIDRTSEESEILISNSIFQNVSLRTPRKTTQLSFSTFLTPQAVRFVNVTLKNITITTSKSLIDMDGPSSFSIEGSTFQTVSASGLNGIIKLSTPLTYIYNNTFADIDVQAEPGVFYLATYFHKHTIKILNNTFDGLASNTETAILTVEPVEITDLENDEATLDLEIIGCHANNINMTSIIHFTSVNCSNCTIQENSFYMADKMKIETRMIDLDSKSSGLMILQENLISSFRFATEYFIFMTDCEIKVLVSRMIHDAAYTSFSLARLNSGYLEVRDSKFKNILLEKLPIINTLSSKLLEHNITRTVIINTTFENINAVTPVKSDNLGYLELINNGSQLNLTITALIISTSSTSLDITSCRFENITSMPAILYNSLSEGRSKPNNYTSISVKNSVFHSLNYVFGPAITVLPSPINPLVTIKNSTFKDNSASIGGALAIYNSSITIINSGFMNNEADILGGAIIFGEHAEARNKIINSTFIDNHARAGNDIGYEAVDFNISFSSKAKNGIHIKSIRSPDKHDFHQTIILSNVSSEEFSSGTLRICYVDANNKPTPQFYEYSKSVIKVPTNTPLNILDKYQALIQGDLFDPTCHIIPLDSIVIGGKGDQTAELDLNISVARIQNLRKVYLRMRPCHAGEYNKSFVCQACPSSSFSITAGESCTNCPSNAKCVAGSSICPISGYWNLNASTPNIIPCRDDGINRCSNDQGCQSCATGYSGPLCSACDYENLYMENGYLSCGMCTDLDSSLKYSILSSFIFFLYQVFSIYMVFTGDIYKKGARKDFLIMRAIERSYYIKSLLTYTQLMSLLYMTNWEMYKTLGLTFQIGDPSTLITYGTQCSMAALGIDHSNFIHYQTLLVVASPFIQLFLFALIILAVCLVKQSFRPFKIVGVAALYLIISEQPGIVTNLGQYMSCSTVQDLGYLYISSHPSWSCDTDQYAFYKKFLVVPGLIVLCVVVPIGIFIALCVSKNKVRSHADLETSFGIITNELQDKYYFWGVILMTMKLVFSFLVYGLEQKIDVQIFASLVMLWIYQSLVRLFKPYKLKAFNSLEITLMNILMFNIVLTQYLIDPANGALVSNSSLVLGILLNVGFLVFVMWKVLSLTFLNAVAFVESTVLRRQMTKKTGRERLLDSSIATDEIAEQEGDLDDNKHL